MDASDEAQTMRRGLLLSGGMHLVLVLLALFSGQFFRSDEARAIQIAEVDLMTGAEFDAAISTAPAAPRTEVAEIAPPEEGASDVVKPEATDRPSSREAETPETSEEEARPDLSGVRAQARAEARTEAPRSPELPPEDSVPEGASLVRPEVLGPPVPEQANRKPNATVLERPAPPRPAPRIASDPAPKPPTEARRAAEASPEVAPADEVTETREEKPQEAPPESASAIVPELAEETETPESVAPLTSGRPLGRPQRLAAAAPADEPEPPAAEAPEEPRPRLAEQAQPPRPSRQAEPRPAQTRTAEARPARPSGSDLPVGPPLTAVEKDGIRLKVKQNWNVVNIQGRPDFRDLIVTVRFELDREGNVVGKAVEPVTPANPTGPLRLAFDLARRAVLKSEPFQMPPEKFAQWRLVEITFNPSKGIGY
ncbi:MAG TPA: hypothetical protein VFR34_10040 [Paracoccaceae bacterium]|nr:hypothetical protein [Paracoccaceae bacterium]